MLSLSFPLSWCAQRLHGIPETAANHSGRCTRHVSPAAARHQSRPRKQLSRQHVRPISINAYSSHAQGTSGAAGLLEPRAARSIFGSRLVCSPYFYLFLFARIFCRTPAGFFSEYTFFFPFQRPHSLGREFETENKMGNWVFDFDLRRCYYASLMAFGVYT